MGQVRDGSATTTSQSLLQYSDRKLLARLSQELGINPKTLAKWRKRETIEDLKTGPKEPRSTVLTDAEEAAVVAFRRHTLLALDDRLYTLQPPIPQLARSALYRCLQRHGISRLPDVKGDRSRRAEFNRYPIGFFRCADLRCTSTSPRCRLPSASFTCSSASTGPPRSPWPNKICQANGFEHRLTQPNHSWTNGRVERMNRTIKEASIKRFNCESHGELRVHLTDFLAAYNFARRLKNLNGLTTYEYICRVWTSEPDRFILDPIHQTRGLKT